MSSIRLIYWPGLPGRGEFVRLCLVEADQTWEEVGSAGPKAVMDHLLQVAPGPRPLAPPILEIDGTRLAQSTNICLYLGRRFGIGDDDSIVQAAINQHLLTAADLAVEAHDTHHPLGKSLYYEEQKDAALDRSRLFREQRLSKFLVYFEHVLQDNGGEWLAGTTCSVADLYLFQVLMGIEHAFPRAWARVSATTPTVVALKHRVASRPRIAAYLPTRQPFTLHGLFRAYPELDDPES